ncbi:unnamed protein product, partial [Polarella glacialis]
ALFLDWLPGWPVRSRDLLSLLERHGAVSCALRPNPGPWSGSLLPAARIPLGGGQLSATGQSAEKKLRVAMLGGHNFGFDCLLASRDAAKAQQLKWEGGIFGYTLAETYPATSICKVHLDDLSLSSWPEEPGSGSLCRPTAGMTRVMGCFDLDLGLGTASGCSVHEVRKHMEEARASDSLLREPSLLICSYPYALCAVYGKLESTAATPMLFTVKGAGSLAEYVDSTLQPWVLGVYKEWLSSSERPPSDSLRQVVVMDRVDVPILQNAFGSAIAEPKLVEFGARYVLQITGGVRCDLRAESPNVLLIWRLAGLLPSLDYMAVYRYIIDFMSYSIVNPAAGEGTRWDIQLQ